MDYKGLDLYSAWNKPWERVLKREYTIHSQVFSSDKVWPGSVAIYLTMGRIWVTVVWFVPDTGGLWSVTASREEGKDSHQGTLIRSHEEKEERVLMLHYHNSSLYYRSKGHNPVTPEISQKERIRACKLVNSLGTWSEQRVKKNQKCSSWLHFTLLLWQSVISNECKLTKLSL